MKPQNFLSAFLGAVLGFLFAVGAFGFTAPAAPTQAPPNAQFKAYGNTGAGSLTSTYIYISSPYFSTGGAPTMIPRNVPCTPAQSIGLWDDGGDVGVICH